MKKIICTTIFLVNLFQANMFAQTASGDEKIRKVLMVQYLDPMQFIYDSAEGEAIANITIAAFKETLEVIKPDTKNLTENDKTRILALVFALENLQKGTAPSWEDLITLEKHRLIEVDKAMSRTSRYKQPEKK